MTIQELKKRKKELGYSNEEVSRLSGVPLGTVIKVFSGATKTPRSRTLQALETALAPKNEQKYSDSGLPAFIVREAPSRYENAAGQPVLHTIEDYYRLPDDVRCELIDGVFYDMAAPSFNHQFIPFAPHSIMPRIMDIFNSRLLAQFSHTVNDFFLVFLRLIIRRKYNAP